MTTAVARTRSAAVVGLHAVEVVVEVTMSSGLPGVHVIGSSGSAAREASDRVRAALAAVGLPLPQRKILMSLAPADVPKAGARFDLALAAAVLIRLDAVDPERLAGTAFLGELALDGAVRPVPGVLPCADALVRRGIQRLLVADENAAEAALVARLEVVPVAHLTETLAVLRGTQAARACPAVDERGAAARIPDLADVRGQHEARRALEIAATGGHHLLLLGPPGCGKSMLAARLTGLLPRLTDEQALELTAVRSVAGLLTAAPAAEGRPVLDRMPPFRAPHHATSAAAMLGGGSGVARPGEVSLALHGVLLMDELFEWPRRLLEALREPLEEGRVRVARSRATVTYPARFLLVCAANPCPCGGADGCECPEAVVWAYRQRLSGPLADRIDLAPRMSALRAQDLVDRQPGEPTAKVALRVRAGRGAARQRWGTTNANASASQVRTTASPGAIRVLARAVECGQITGRGFDRALRVARTCADLAGRESVESEHALEALAHRMALRGARAVGGLRDSRSAAT